MDRFGSDLLLMFLAKAWPDPDITRIEYATWDDVVEIFFNSAPMIREAAVSTGREWTPDAIEETDLWLMKTAESGQFIGSTSISPQVAEELWRRWTYAITAAELENMYGSELNIAFPADAPDELKGFGLALYILGGPARDYPAVNYPDD